MNETADLRCSAQERVTDTRGDPSCMSAGGINLIRQGMAEIPFLAHHRSKCGRGLGSLSE
jgi:hypothetical protein